MWPFRQLCNRSAVRPHSLAYVTGILAVVAGQAVVVAVLWGHWPLYLIVVLVVGYVTWMPIFKIRAHRDVFEQVGESDVIPAEALRLASKAAYDRGFWRIWNVAMVILVGGFTGGWLSVGCDTALALTMTVTSYLMVSSGQPGKRLRDRIKEKIPSFHVLPSPAPGMAGA